MWGKEHQEVASKLFNSFDAHSLKWMILRNYEGLPYKNRSKDIDILLEKKDFDLATKIMFQVCKEEGFTYYIKGTYQYAWCYTFFRIMEGRVISVKIDFMDGFFWRGAELISFSHLYNNKVRYNNFFVPDECSDGYMLWIKPLLTGGFVKEKYRNDVLNAINTYPEKFHRLLKQNFRSKNSSKVWEILESKNLDLTVPLYRSLRSDAWIKGLLTNPISTLYRTCEHFFTEFKRRSYRKHGNFFSVQGPDGVGKTTFINLLKDELTTVMVKDSHNVRVQHFRPKLFPNIKTLLSGKSYNENNENFSDPHRAKPAKNINALVRLIYYWLDYVFGYWMKLRSEYLSGKIYIFDRYFYDIVVDPHRSRIDLPNWLRSFFLLITPKPDVVFFLHLDHRLVYKRKQELHPDEIQRQNSVYLGLVKKYERLVMLDASQKPEQICFSATKCIIQKTMLKL